MATENKSPLSVDPKKLVHPQRHWLGVRGYDVITEEYGSDGTLTKVTRGHQRGRMVWDWVQLLIIPFVIGAGAIWFNVQQSRVSLQVSQAQHTSDQRIAQDQQRATILQTYIDSIQDSLFNHNLLKSGPHDEARNLARARTLIALHRLIDDPSRKGDLLEFLYDTDLITRNNVIIDLRLADLSYAELSGVSLRYAELEIVFMPGADLGYADLIGTDLNTAYMSGINMSYAHLRGAILDNAVLTNAILIQADLRDVNLSGADLSGANLSGANLSNAVITDEQLAQVKSLYGAIMPDGSKHP